jgi:hypothetical protein
VTAPMRPSRAGRVGGEARRSHVTPLADRSELAAAMGGAWARRRRRQRAWRRPSTTDWPRHRRALHVSVAANRLAYTWRCGAGRPGRDFGTSAPRAVPSIEVEPVSAGIAAKQPAHTRTCLPRDVIHQAAPRSVFRAWIVRARSRARGAEPWLSPRFSQRGWSESPLPWPVTPNVLAAAWQDGIAAIRSRSGYGPFTMPVTVISRPADDDRR